MKNYLLFQLEFNLNLPGSTCMQEIKTAKLIKELERKYEESLRNLTFMEEIKEFKTQKEKLQEEENNRKIMEQNLLENELDNDNELDNFKIEPVKEKDTLMITALTSKKATDNNPFAFGDTEINNDMTVVKEEKENTGFNLQEENKEKDNNDNNDNMSINNASSSQYNNRNNCN